MTKFYLSTIAADAVRTAKANGFGLELAEYCTAWNMDQKREAVDGVVKKKLEGLNGCILHAPYNELFPCAIDPKARELAAFRYGQAIELAKGYGASKVVIHGGFTPRVYFPIWYTGQSTLFWKAFLQEDPGVDTAPPETSRFQGSGVMRHHDRDIHFGSFQNRYRTVFTKDDSLR